MQTKNHDILTVEVEKHIAAYADARADCTRRQRDTLLKLIKEA